jgi:hypothetical protein
VDVNRSCRRCKALERLLREFASGLLSGALSRQLEIELIQQAAGLGITFDLGSRPPRTNFEAPRCSTCIKDPTPANCAGCVDDQFRGLAVALGMKR